MKRSSIVWLVVLILCSTGGAAAAPKSGTTTINLRTCIDAGDGACQTQGDVALDDITVCLRSAGSAEQCVATEDGEWWVDSQPRGSYRARVEPPAGYQLDGITCTTFPNIPYSACTVKGQQVRVVIRAEVTAVTVNFLLAPAAALP